MADIATISMKHDDSRTSCNELYRQKGLEIWNRGTLIDAIPPPPSRLQVLRYGEQQVLDPFFELGGSI